LLNNKIEKFEAAKNIIIDTIREQNIDILKAVLNKFFNCILLLSLSAVYFITPLFIAPFAKVKTIVIKFVKEPTYATPTGPVISATTLPAIKPLVILIKEIIPLRIVVLNIFKKHYLVAIN
jgi:hypothetical protein